MSSSRRRARSSAAARRRTARPQYAGVPDLPGLPGRATGPEPGRGRARDPCRAGSRLRAPPALDLRAQALLLSRPPEGLPDLPVRPAACDGRDRWRSGSMTGARRESGSRASISRRMPASRRMRPTALGSTSTAAGRPDRDRLRARPREPARGVPVPVHAQAGARVPGRLRLQHGGGACGATRTCRSAAR